MVLDAWKRQYSNTKAKDLTGPVGMKRNRSDGEKAVEGEENLQPTDSTESFSHLPPGRRAQILLKDMAVLSRSLLEPAGAAVAAAEVLSPETSNTQSATDVMEMLQVQQLLLTIALRELQESEMPGTQAQVVKASVERIHSSMKSFALSLYNAQDKLTTLLEEYKDYKQFTKDTDSANAEAKQEKEAAAPKKARKVEDKSMPHPVDVRDIVAYSEHICMTTFAPPEYAQGRSTMPVPPPCPQEFQLKNSQLYHCSESSVGISRVVKEPTPPPQPLTPTPTAQGHPGMPLVPPPGWKPGDPIGKFLDKRMGLPPMPPGWKPGDPLGKIPLPPMPAGWKPGDPVPMPPVAAAGVRVPAGGAVAAAGGAGAASAVPAGGIVLPQAPLPVHHLRPPPAQPVLQVGHVSLDFDDDDEEEDEDEEESDEDDEDDE